MWQINDGLSVADNIEVAIDYFRGKYGDTFTVVMMRPELCERVNGDTGLKIVPDESMTPGHIIFFSKGV